MCGHMYVRWCGASSRFQMMFRWYISIGFAVTGQRVRGHFKVLQAFSLSGNAAVIDEVILWYSWNASHVGWMFQVDAGISFWGPCCYNPGSCLNNILHLSSVHHDLATRKSARTFDIFLLRKYQRNENIKRNCQISFRFFSGCEMHYVCVINMLLYIVKIIVSLMLMLSGFSWQDMKI